MSYDYIELHDMHNGKHPIIIQDTIILVTLKFFEPLCLSNRIKKSGIHDKPLVRYLCLPDFIYIELVKNVYYHPDYALK